MTNDRVSASDRGNLRPYAAEIEREHDAWREVSDLVYEQTPEERLEPGYYRNPDWTVRDVVAHLGTWLAEAQVQFERMSAGTYAGHDVDVDALNAALLAAMDGQPWDVAWVQANAARNRMLDAWREIPARSDEADWWIRKAGPDHYAEHLGRLREWTRELIAKRAG
jgi:hypothetical protein